MIPVPKNSSTCPNMYFGFVCIKRTPILLMRISYVVM